MAAFQLSTMHFSYTCQAFQLSRAVVLELHLCPRTVPMKSAGHLWSRIHNLTFSSQKRQIKRMFCVNHRRKHNLTKELGQSSRTTTPRENFLFHLFEYRTRTVHVRDTCTVLNWKARKRSLIYLRTSDFTHQLQSSRANTRR